MIRPGMLALGAVVATLLALLEGRASLHHPDDPMAVLVSAAGVPEPLPFDEFGRRRLVLLNAGNPQWPLDGPDPNDPTKRLKSDRGIVKDRIDKGLKLRDRTQVQSVALAVDQLRFGRPGEADGALVAKHRQGYLGNVTLAHIAVAQGDWGRAFNFFSIVNEELPPKQFPGLTPQQLAWQLKLNSGSLLKLARLRMEEARGAKPAPESELPDRIFDVNFVNAAGVYEPGVLAPAEQAKLPSDSLAIVQQLVLWFPTDPRLYWLLAEVYAAKSEFSAARKIMDECVSTFTYSNRKILMQHREAVTRAADAKGAPPDEPLFATPDAPLPPPPISMRTVWIYFGAVAAVALFAVTRALVKWRRAASR